MKYHFEVPHSDRMDSCMYNREGTYNRVRNKIIEGNYTERDEETANFQKI